MKRRTRRSLPASLTALVLLGAGVVTTISAVQHLTGDRPWLDITAIASALHSVQWTDQITLVAAAVVAVLGLVLVLAAVLPGAVTVLPLAGTPDSGITRSGYRSALRTAANDVDGVSAAEAAIGTRRVTVRATTARTHTEGLTDAVRAAVETRLDELAPSRRPAVVVKLRARREES
ncbi:DUF6286 domain-containing protein [Lentzea sp.]|uniref:DUF6286 domain-containing protein n=1 Tax=Lentzea sp. TaxID=56099 RepID=UPI002ECFB055